MSSWHHIVAPPSLKHWFGFFTTHGAPDIHHVGSGELDGAALLESLRLARATHAVIHSSHESLRRDCDIADQLRQAGMTVVAQSRQCTELGTDKPRMKRYLTNAGFKTPAPASLDGRWVVKRRGGTEAAGIRLEHIPPDFGPQEYTEQFVDGEEFSVVLFAWRDRIITFPPVYKGPTRLDLLPPYRRPRVTPVPAQFAPYCAMLRDVARRAAYVSYCEGWMEVEFAVTADRDPVIFEFNPRISGTMRLSAMATGTRIFDLPEILDGVDDDVRAIRHAAETPWKGPPIADPLNEVFATSRITTAAETIAELTTKLATLGSEPIRYWQVAHGAARSG